MRSREGSKRSGEISPMTTSPRWKGKKEKLLGLLQQKYGYAKDKAEQEYKDFIDRLKGK